MIVQPVPLHQLSWRLGIEFFLHKHPVVLTLLQCCFYRFIITPLSIFFNVRVITHLCLLLCSSPHSLTFSLTLRLKDGQQESLPIFVNLSLSWTAANIMTDLNLLVTSCFPDSTAVVFLHLICTGRLAQFELYEEKIHLHINAWN